VGGPLEPAIVAPLTRRFQPGALTVRWLPAAHALTARRAVRVSRACPVAVPAVLSETLAIGRKTRGYRAVGLRLGYPMAAAAAVPWARETPAVGCR
jgi:hypothetical protein